MLVDWGSGAQAIVFGNVNGDLFAVDGASGASLPGWPVILGPSNFNGDPAVWDVDFDGAPEVLVGTPDGFLHAMKANGAEVPGWPKSFGSSIGFGPAVGNVAGTLAF